MSKIRSKNTKIELLAKAMLEPLGFIYQPNQLDLGLPKSPYHKPDFAHPKWKVVVFVDGCFWHVCPSHFKMPKSNVEFWRAKMERNKRRDKLANRFWRGLGWKVVRIWGHDLKPTNA